MICKGIKLNGQPCGRYTDGGEFCGYHSGRFNRPPTGRLRTPPPGSFGCREERALDGATLAVITCVRCDREVGRFGPAELFVHLASGKRYACATCDA